jgi:hypothetical protein
MNTIVFDVVYKKRMDSESIKLSPESQFQQLKIMLCGKYKIFDMTKLCIYYKNSLLNPINETQKIKEIFPTKKVLLQISNTPLLSKKSEKSSYFKYLCKCGNGALNICDKCEEFLCDFCIKKKKHITHNQNVIKINEYWNFVKKLIQNMASELDEKIINDEAYKFLRYWNYDKDKEINGINTKYDYLKNILEDMKQIEIDYLVYLIEGNNYENLKKEVIETINQYSNFSLHENDIEEIVKQKNNIVKLSQELFNKYNTIKIQLLNYTKNLRDLQTFNQIFQNFIQDKFNFIKKKINLNNNSCNNSEIMMKSRYFTLNNDILNNSIKDSSTKNYNEDEDKNSKVISVKINSYSKGQNFSPKIKINQKLSNSSSKLHGVIKISNLQNSKKDKDKDKRNKIKELSDAVSSPEFNSSFAKTVKKQNYKSLEHSPNIQTHKTYEHLLFKLKDKHKILAFSFENQNFTEKSYIDKSNFRKELISEKDIIQLNLNNKLFILSGKRHNKFYCYNYHLNTISFINNTLYSHYYGGIIYCPKNKKIYLIGGNGQTNCEMYTPSTSANVSNLSLNQFNPLNSWKKIARLNEERQEFASMYFKDYIYVFFGFSYSKGSNLSSIERINVNKNNKFELVYINEQITLSSLSCAHYQPEFDHGTEKEGILLLGGFDGTKYIENSLVFSPDKMKIRECDVIIPNISKHFQFLFHQESNFIEIDKDIQCIFDLKNNIHLLTKDSYELLSEV